MLSKVWLAKKKKLENVTMKEIEQNSNQPRWLWRSYKDFFGTLTF